MTYQKLLKEREVANLTGLSVRGLQQKRTDGGGPPFVRIGRTIRYPYDDLIQWVNSLERLDTTTGE